jgi:hypothetical protein
MSSPPVWEHDGFPRWPWGEPSRRRLKRIYDVTCEAFVLEDWIQQVLYRAACHIWEHVAQYNSVKQVNNPGHVMLLTLWWPGLRRTPNLSCIRLIIYLWSSSMSGLICASPKCSKHLWRTRYPYWSVHSSKTLPLKAEMKLRRSAGTRSISLCTTLRHVRRSNK